VADPDSDSFGSKDTSNVYVNCPCIHLIPLQNCRYFIVIDDVWDEEIWKLFEYALVDNSCGSRVIVTTRNFRVAKLCATPVAGALFELEPLSNADSKRLFYKRVFGKDGGNHNQLDLEEIAGRILKKCGGVPLAIITIASLLASKPIKEWYRVYRSLGSGLDKDNTDIKSMHDILSLSYYELPSYLRPCLLYLSLFPEDCRIDKDSLVRRWVAEGLVVDEQGGGNLYELYDRGEKYFIELVNRSFIQPLDIDGVDGIPNACSVHDLILDLLISLSVEDNFGLRLDSQNFTTSTDSEVNIRRLSLQDNEVEVSVPETVDLSHVRSVIAFGDAFNWAPPLSRFKFLRALDLEGFPGKNNHPKELRRLHHLRYLQLRGYLQKEVLEEIGNLQHLTMLDLSHAYVSQLPVSITRLRNLQSLLVGSDVKMPQGIGSLSKLEEMSWIEVEPNTAAELGKLTEMRVLCVHGLGYDEAGDQAFLQSLSNLRNLLGLFITESEMCSLDDLPDPGQAPVGLRFFRGTETTFQQMPRWFSWLSELSGLTITVNNLTQDDIDMLGALPELRLLQLEVAENGTIAQEQLSIGSGKLFQSLEAFKFKHCARCLLVLSQGVMTRLQKLELYFEVRKRDDGAIDVGLENLNSLKHVTVEVDCYRANIRQVEDVETKFRDALDAHPKNPTLELSRVATHCMERDEHSSGRHQR
jgi:Leucine-rich repeat (LRR) protein